MYRLTGILFMVFLLAACGGRSRDYSDFAVINYRGPVVKANHGYTTKPAAPRRNGSVKHALYSQYHEWRGVRYRIGGMSRRGIDCSRFVYLTYINKFGVVLPKNTRKQVMVGRTVSRYALKPGDLIFFRTGYGSRHVGIYLKRGRFLHASTSRGVTISRLRSRYWSRRYWTSRRILSSYDRDYSRR